MQKLAAISENMLIIQVITNLSSHEKTNSYLSNVKPNLT